MKNIFIYLVLFPLGLLAQQDAYFSLNTYQMNLINPAYAGADGGQSFLFSSRNQWSGVSQAPKTMALAYSSERGKSVGLGLSVISDQIFVEKQALIMIDFSYRLTLEDESYLFLGLKAGGGSYRTDPSELSAYASEADPTKKALSRFNPNVGMGFLYRKSNFWLSASIPRLFNTKRDEDIAIQARDRVHIYLAAGTKFAVNEDVHIQPNFIYRKAEGIKAVTDVGMIGSYRNTFDFGLAFRTGSIVSIQTAIKLKGIYTVGYAYDSYGANQFSQLNLNAHQLFLAIQLPSIGR